MSDDLVSRNIAKHGCHVTHVFDDQSDEPDFSYSTGFPETVGQPDIIVFGLPFEIMHSMINDTHQQASQGLLLRDGVAIEDLLEGFKCIGREVHQSNFLPLFFGESIARARTVPGASFEHIVQIVWPSAVNGLFPWDDGCAQEVRDLQPALYEARLDA